MTSVFERRIRGFRLTEIVALGCLIAIVFGVYLAKTMAGREHQELARIERQMADERQRIRLLKAEVAHLEQPERMERLSSAYLGLKPVESGREAPEESLQEIARLRGDTEKAPDSRYGKSKLLPQPKPRAPVAETTTPPATEPAR